MNIDQKIKQALENDSLDIDALTVDNEGLFARLSGSFKGGMRNWVILIYSVAFVTGMLLLWCGYQFYVAGNVSDQIFWGVSFLVALNMQGFIKQWLFMETNRNSIMREIKRVEVAVTKLSIEKQ